MKNKYFEKICDEAEKYMAEGWSVTMAFGKAGMSHSNLNRSEFKRYPRYLEIRSRLPKHKRPVSVYSKCINSQKEST